MNPHLAEVVTLFKDNASDIAAMLRQAADTIESETDDDARTKAVVAVQLHEDGQIQIYGWGATDSLSAIATLDLGKAKLIRQHFGDGNE